MAESRGSKASRVLISCRDALIRQQLYWGFRESFDPIAGFAHTPEDLEKIVNPTDRALPLFDGAVIDLGVSTFVQNLVETLQEQKQSGIIFYRQHDAEHPGDDRIYWIQGDPEATDLQDDFRDAVITAYAQQGLIKDARTHSTMLPAQLIASYRRTQDARELWRVVSQLSAQGGTEEVCKVVESYLESLLLKAREDPAARRCLVEAAACEIRRYHLKQDPKMLDLAERMLNGVDESSPRGGMLKEITRIRHKSPGPENIAKVEAIRRTANDAETTAVLLDLYVASGTPNSIARAHELIGDMYDRKTIVRPKHVVDPLSRRPGIYSLHPAKLDQAFLITTDLPNAGQLVVTMRSPEDAEREERHHATLKQHADELRSWNGHQLHLKDKITRVVKKGGERCYLVSHELPNTVSIWADLENAQNQGGRGYDARERLRVAEIVLDLTAALQQAGKRHLKLEPVLTQPFLYEENRRSISTNYTTYRILKDVLRGAVLELRGEELESVCRFFDGVHNTTVDLPQFLHCWFPDSHCGNLVRSDAHKPIDLDTQSVYLTEAKQKFLATGLWDFVHVAESEAIGFRPGDPKIEYLALRYAAAAYISHHNAPSTPGDAVTALRSALPDRGYGKQKEGLRNALQSVFETCRRSLESYLGAVSLNSIYRHLILLGHEKKRIESCQKMLTENMDPASRDEIENYAERQRDYASFHIAHIRHGLAKVSSGDVPGKEIQDILGKHGILSV